MNCNEFKKLIFTYLSDGNLESKIKEEFEEHYFECDDCFNELEIGAAITGEIKDVGVEKLLDYDNRHEPDIKKIIISPVGSKNGEKIIIDDSVKEIKELKLKSFHGKGLKKLNLGKEKKKKKK